MSFPIDQCGKIVPSNYISKVKNYFHTSKYNDVKYQPFLTFANNYSVFIRTMTQYSLVILGLAKSKAIIKVENHRF